jgi:hypothetical protein
MIALISQQQDVINFFKNSLPHDEEVLVLRGEREILSHLEKLHPLMIFIDGVNDKENQTKDDYPLYDEIRFNKVLTAIPIVLIHFVGSPNHFTHRSDFVISHFFDKKNISDLIFNIKKFHQWESHIWDQMMKIIRDEKKWLVLGRFVGQIIHELNNPITIITMQFGIMDRLIKKIMDEGGGANVIAQEKLGKGLEQIVVSVKKVSQILSEMNGLVNEISTEEKNVSSGKNSDHSQNLENTGRVREILKKVINEGI